MKKFKYLNDYNNYLNHLNETKKSSNDDKEDDKELESRLKNYKDKYGEIIGELLYLCGNEIPLFKNETARVFKSLYNNPLTLNNVDMTISGKDLNKDGNIYTLNMNDNANNVVKMDIKSKVSFMSYFKQVAISSELRSTSTVGMIASFFDNSTILSGKAIENIDDDLKDIVSKNFTPIQIGNVIYKINSTNKVQDATTINCAYASYKNIIKNYINNGTDEKLKNYFNGMLGEDNDIIGGLNMIENKKDRDDVLKILNGGNDIYNGIIFCVYNYKKHVEETTTSDNDIMTNINKEIYNAKSDDNIGNTGFKNITIYIISPKVIENSFRNINNNGIVNLKKGSSNTTINISIDIKSITNDTKGICILNIIPPFVKTDDIEKTLYNEKDNIRGNISKYLDEFDDDGLDKEMIEYAKKNTSINVLKNILDVLNNLNKDNKK